MRYNKVWKRLSGLGGAPAWEVREKRFVTALRQSTNSSVDDISSIASMGHGSWGDERVNSGPGELGLMQPLDTSGFRDLVLNVRI